MDEDEIRLLINQNEGETLEFKQFEKLENLNDKKKKDLAKLFVALANKKGGRILFGVTDDRKFDGYKLTEEKYKEFTQKLVQLASSNCKPPIYLYNIQQINVDGHHILLVEVPPGKNLPHIVNGKFYIRSLDQNSEISDPNIIRELFEKKVEKNQEIIIKKEENLSPDTFSTLINEYLNSIIHDDIESGISEVYTELSAKLPEKIIFPIAVKFDESENEREKESGVFELVEKEKRLIISGVSGSGKTITLKWLNITFAEKYLREGDCSIPLYIELNSYKEGNFYDYIKIKSKEKGLSESTLELLLKGNLIFLIDGLDLLSSTEGFALKSEISNFISEYSDCRYVISSRPGFFDGIQNKFKISELKELDETNIQSFVNNYIIDEKLANIITGQILNDDKLISLFKNPMMLYIAIIVINSRLEDGIEINDVLPSKRSNLYGIFISELFKHHIRKGKSLNADKTQILDTLTNLYFKLQCQNDVDCKYKYAIKIALEHSDAKTPIFAKNILDDLFNTGLLLKDETRNEIDDYIKFGIHQSFLEYFAALKLNDCFESGYDLSPVFNHPKWEEVVIFAAEMFDNPDDFVDKIIDSHELDLASKCAQNASKDIKEKLCKLLAEKIDGRFISERTVAIDSLGRLGDIGISLVIEALADEDYMVQLNAVSALGKIKSDEAVEHLIKLLDEGDHFMQNHAADALRKIKSEKAIELLIKALTEGEYEVRGSAADALGIIKSDKAVEHLIKALAEGDDEVRGSAAYALGKIKSDKAVEHLIKALAEGDDKVRWGATYALGEIKSDKAVEHLIKALAEGDDKVRRSATYALGKIKSHKAVDEAVEQLGKELNEGGNILNFLLIQNRKGMLKAPVTGENEVRRIAADAIEKIKFDEAVEPLIKELTEVDEEVRRRIADNLESSFKELAEWNEVRRNAAESIEKMKSVKAVEPLIKALTEGDEVMRRSAADALGEIKSDKTVEPLIKALAEGDDGVRRSAADALGKIKSDKAVKPLTKALGDGDYLVQMSAADALREIITTENKYLLKPLLESENEYVVNKLYDILKKINQNDRSEKEITLKKRSISEKDDSNKPDNQELPCGRPAEEGLKDPYIGSFVDRIKSIKEPTSIADYGCGQGKLLCALTTLPDEAIENIYFLAVDEKTRCRYTSRLTAEKYGLFNLFKTEPEFLNPKDFYAKDITLDYALLMHAMHEIKLLDLIEIIYTISVKLKMGGQMFILDQRELIETERSFVLWDDKKDFEILFSDSGLEISQRFFDTGSNKKLSSIEVKKVQDDCFSREKVARNCMEVYELKKNTVSGRIDRKGISDEEFQELNILYSNISRQINEYNKSICK